jgi:anti-anti-sigma factor
MERPQIDTIRADDATCIVALRGDHDLSTCPNLRETFDRISHTCTCVVIDLSEATFVDSSVLSQLVGAHRRSQETNGEQFAVVAPAGSPAARLFDMTGAEDVLPTYATRAGAVRSCSRPAPTPT